MTYFKIIKCLDSLPPSMEQKFSSLKRTKQYYAARVALIECLAQALPDKSLPTAESVEITGHLHLKEHPEALVSLSHTGPDIGAALVAINPSYLSIGVDIEPIGRTIDQKATRYFMAKDDDQEYTKQLLLCWSLKEAAFKALSPLIANYTEDTNLVLSRIWLKDDQFGLVDHPQLPLGKFEYRSEQLPFGEFIVSQAYLLKTP